MTFRLTLLALLTIILADATALATDNAGFIYGTVTLRDGGQHTGFLRWESEEAFWDDLFHSLRDEIPWLEHVDLAELQAERRRRYFETHGMFDRVMWTLTNRGDDLHVVRVFISRFGHLDGIEIDEDENIVLRIVDGGREGVGGYSNDVSSDLIVYPAEGEPLELDWDDLAGIDFAPAPADAVPYAERLYGTVTSTEGTYEGFIQWDQSECTSIDILDGDDRKVPMGDLQSLTKNRKGTSNLVLKNGEAFTLGGSNDVGGGNRGAMVEHPAWGRVTVPWKRFHSVTFAPPPGSGPGKDAYASVTPLQGTVMDTEGGTWTGRIVYDLDEAWSRDIFNGSLRDHEYDIPFALIESIARRNDESCRVTLASGRVLDLSDSQDTGDEHAGVLVFISGKPHYLPWSRVATIDFAD